MSWYSDGLLAGWLGFESGRSKAFLFSTAPRLSLHPTQPHIHRVPAHLISGVKRLGREAGQSLPSSAEVKNGGATPPFPHTSSSVVLN
jgi:hypothetical protein